MNISTFNLEILLMLITDFGFVSTSFCSVRIFDLAHGGSACEIDRPRTGVMQFSPGNTILATWEPYMGKLSFHFNRGICEQASLCIYLRDFIQTYFCFCLLDSDKRSSSRYTKP